jgi:hypothetical protein
MKKEYSFASILVALVAVLGMATAAAEGPRDDVFKGKLFPPNIILENQAELGLSKDQFTAIRAAVVNVQSNIAEHEWDMREAYLLLLAELDKSPIDEARVVEHASKAMLAENEVKKKQVVMLIRLKNLLNPDQIAYLESVYGE